MDPDPHGRCCAPFSAALLSSFVVTTRMPVRSLPQRV